MAGRLKTIQSRTDLKIGLRGINGNEVAEEVPEVRLGKPENGRRGCLNWPEKEKMRKKEIAAGK
jgi:hypothetical protein